MDAPPTKRRRTSPRLSGRQSPETEKDAQAAAQPTTTPPDGAPNTDAPRSSKLPSFASPTKASLAKHHPQILERRRSQSRSRDNRRSASIAEPQPMSQPDTAENSAQLAPNQSEEAGAAQTAPRPLSQPPVRSPTRSPARSPARSPTRSPARSLGRSPSRSPSRNLGSAWTEPPRRSPVKPVPRPLPPPDPQRSEDILQPLMAYNKRKSALDLFRTHEEEPDPELPPTPEHAEKAMSPPSGIHQHSTPSKRRKSRSHSKRSKKQNRDDNTTSGTQPSRNPKRLRDETGGEEKHKDDENTTAKRRASKTHPARQIRVPEPDAAKKKERDALITEIARLEADLALAAAANERIRRNEVSPQKHDPKNSSQDYVNDKHDREKIRSLLCRTILPQQDAVPDATADWLRAATNPISFLPFGKASNSNTADFAALLASSSTSGDAAPERDGGDVGDNVFPSLSHHPLPMTAAEELPFLQAFTPLAFQSNVILLPRTSLDDPLLQQHRITATSTNPPGVFMARIDMTVNTKSLKITDLAVPQIDPAAEPELRSIIHRVARSSQKEVGSALVRNVTVLTWAMGEWVRVAVRRALFWAQLEKQLCGKDAELSAATRGFRSRQHRLHKKRRRNGAAAVITDDNEHDDEDDNDSDGEDELSAQPKDGSADKTVPLAELLPHLGRTALDIDLPLDATAKPGSMRGVRIQWSIEFDWTGEARSKLGLLVGVPGNWRKADDRGHLAGLPKLFHELVNERVEPATAVQTIVALLLGEDSS